MIYIYGHRGRKRPRYILNHDSDTGEKAYIITCVIDAVDVINRQPHTFPGEEIDQVVNKVVQASQKGKCLAIYFDEDNLKIICRVPRGNRIVKQLFIPKENSKRRIYGTKGL